MQIYNHIAPSFFQFTPLDLRNVFSNNLKTQAKVVAIALAIFSAFIAVAVATYCILSCCDDMLDDVDDVDQYSIIDSTLDPNDPLQKCTAEFADHIDEILNTVFLSAKRENKLRTLQSFLTHTNHKYQIHNYCLVSGKRGYEPALYKSFNEGFERLCEFLKDKEFPIEKKMEILERLEKERDQCIPGIAGLLHDICSSVDEPLEMGEKLPWLVARYKVEVIRAVVTEVHATNCFIRQYGVEFGLPASVIKAAQADLHVDQMFTTPSLDYVNTLILKTLKKYRFSCTSEGCLDFLENFINSDLPNRAAFRAYILSCLAEKVSDEQVDDQTVQASILAKHKAALENDIKRKKEEHRVKFQGKPALEADVAWEKILKKIKLKEDPFIDATLYANYQYRLNPEDSEDSKLTSEAIKLFAQNALQSLHVPHTKHS